MNDNDNNFVSVPYSYRVTIDIFCNFQGSKLALVHLSRQPIFSFGQVKNNCTSPWDNLELKAAFLF